jgi:bacteriocin-like protein
MKRAMMTKTEKPAVTIAPKPAEQKQPSTELNEQELQQVSGGAGALSKACATGKHFTSVTIVT